MSNNLSRMLEDARRISWTNLGRRITFFLPGMFIQNGVRGKYPAVSITGPRCDLMCEHCRGRLLEPMVAAESPQALLDACAALERDGHYGVLISGGCNRDGCLPWGPFLPAITSVKAKTRLFISVHAGFINDEDAAGLKLAGWTKPWSMSSAMTTRCTESTTSRSASGESWRDWRLFKKRVCRWCLTSSAGSIAGG